MLFKISDLQQITLKDQHQLLSTVKKMIRKSGFLGIKYKETTGGSRFLHNTWYNT